MEWFTAENVVAILTALLGLVASFAVVWYERRVPNHRSIGYRVQMDTAIGDDHRDGRPGPASARLGLFNDLPDMSDATLVLLRVENDGAMSISETDYTSRDPLRGLTAVFTGRTVRGVSVTQSSDAEHLMEYFTAVGGMAQGGGSVHLPRVPLNRGQHYKLLVLLTGGGVGNPVRLTGGIRDGAVTPNRSTTVDDTPPLFSRPARWITVLLTVCVTILATVVITVREDTPSPLGCAKGTLTVVGSTALRPAATDLAEDYTHDCPGSHVGVRAQGSNEGLRELSRAGAEAAPGTTPALIALSDGPAPEGSRLTGERTALAAFALVVNERVTLDTLTLDQIRRIYHGDVLDWHELGGPRLPIRLVSRDADSGTRELFRRKVLGGQAEPAFTSRDCATKNADSDRVVRCELDSTPEVLKTVADTPGAIGYGELAAAQAAASAKGLHTLRINGEAPTSAEAVGESGYPFTEIEYAYTHGHPDPGSLTASFLDYMVRKDGQGVLVKHGHLPCYTPEWLRRCER